MVFYLVACFEKNNNKNKSIKLPGKRAAVNIPYLMNS